MTAEVFSAKEETMWTEMSFRAEDIFVQRM